MEVALLVLIYENVYLHYVTLQIILLLNTFLSFDLACSRWSLICLGGTNKNNSNNNNNLRLNTNWQNAVCLQSDDRKLLQESNLTGRQLRSAPIMLYISFNKCRCVRTSQPYKLWQANSYHLQHVPSVFVTTLQTPRFSFCLSCTSSQVKIV